jgi:nitroreductase
MAMLNDASSPYALLATRRSGKPRDMIGPGPSDAELRAILEVAIRTPDHGKLAPWRFVIVGADQRDALARLLTDAYQAEKPAAGRLELDAIEQFARQAPALVVALHSPANGSHIPQWEQELSTGAAVMNLLHAAHAKGFVGGWLTGWASYNAQVRDAFGTAHEKIAGFVFLGSAGREPEERPRPDYDRAVSFWSPAG